MRLSFKGVQPIKGHKKFAVWYLTANETVELPAALTREVRTGCTIEVPENFAILVLPRPTLINDGVIMPNSPMWIDSDYQTEIKVTLLSLHRPYVIQKGRRLVQLTLINYIDQEYYLNDN